MISIKKIFKVLFVGIILLVFVFTIFTNISLNSNNNSNGLFGYKIYVKDNRLFVLNNKKIFDLDVGDQVVYKNFDNKLLVTRLYSKDNDCYKTKDDSIDMINNNVVCNNNLLGNVVLNITKSHAIIISILIVAGVVLIMALYFLLRKKDDNDEIIVDKDIQLDPIVTDSTKVREDIKSKIINPGKDKIKEINVNVNEKFDYKAVPVEEIKKEVPKYSASKEEKEEIEILEL
ncbi:MAG: hypothetical protein IKE89_03025 [Bacilli bacterium]|nr:hypothetical protein [Bacilli bacterium]